LPPFHARLAVQKAGTMCNRCIKCADHMERPAGDLLGQGKATDAKSDLTACTPKRCEPEAGKGEYVDEFNECKVCPDWEDASGNMADPFGFGKKRDVTAKSNADTRRGAMCQPKVCKTNYRVKVTGTCMLPGAKADGEDYAAKKACGPNNNLKCDTKALCEGAQFTKNGPGQLIWTKKTAVCEKCANGKYIAGHGAKESLSTDEASTTCKHTQHADEVPFPDGHKTHARLALCEADHAVLDHKCTKCPEGYSAIAGDDPNSETDTWIPPHSTGSGSSCQKSVALTPHADLCAKDHYVKAHKCVACPNLGYVNDAGDDWRHHDTACTKVFCKQDHYVLNHVCTPCPRDAQGKHQTNTKGDDASGPNTFCVPQ